MPFASEFAEIIMPDAPLAKRTWFRLGGAAEYLAQPRNLDELATLVTRCRADDIPVRMLGGGSNVLVRDEGVRGLVIDLSAPAFGEVAVDGQVVDAGGGVRLGHLISTAVGAGLAGLEPLVGIPGTVGGALHHNSGTHGGDIGQWTTTATVLTRGGEILQREKEELVFAYRQSSLDELVIVSARFELEQEDPALLTKKMQKQWIVKKANQPPSDVACGQVFKDSSGVAAESIIEQAGMKGHRFEQAQVSSENANFIIAGDGATSDHVLKLIDEVRNRVTAQLGIDMELAVQVW